MICSSPHQSFVIFTFIFIHFEGFPGSSDSKASAWSAGDPDSIPWLGRSPGEGHGYPLQYSCLGNPMNRRAWMAINHGVSRVGNNIVTKPLPPLATNRLPRWHSGKESACQCRRHKRQWFDPWIRKIPWSREGQHTPLFFPAEFHGLRKLEDYSPWGLKESDTTEHATVTHKSY